MNPESIFEYFDGSLNTVEESEFFAQLAENEAARNEFRDELLMKTAVKDDIAAFVPAPESTDKIMKGLGFASTGGGFWSLGKKSFLSGFLLSTVLCLIVAWLLWPEFSEGPTDRNTATLSTSNDINERIYKNRISELDNELEELRKDNFALSGDISNNKEIIEYLRNENQRLSEREYTTEEINTDKFEQQIQQLNSELSDLKDENNKLSQSLRQRENLNYLATKRVEYAEPTYSIGSPPRFSEPIFIAPMVNDSEIEAHKFTVEVGFNDYLQQIPNDFNQRNNGLTQNFSLDAYYKAFEDFEIGISVRRENLFQSFNEITEDNNLIVFEQQPLLWSTGLSLRYNPDELRFYNFQPNTFVTIGGTRVGEMARIGLGLNYYISDNLHIYYRSDYSLLRYFHNDIHYSSAKFGNSVGIGIDF